LHEHAYGTNFTDNVLSDSDLPVRSLKQEIIKVDFSFTLAKAKDHQSLKYVRDIALNGGWMRVILKNYIPRREQSHTVGRCKHCANNYSPAVDFILRKLSSFVQYYYTWVYFVL